MAHSVSQDNCRWTYIETLPTGADPDKVECHYKFDGPTAGLTDRSGNGHNLTNLYDGGGAADDCWVMSEKSLGVAALQLREYALYQGPTGLYPTTLGAHTFECLITRHSMSAYWDTIFAVGGIYNNNTETENSCFWFQTWPNLSFASVGHERDSGSDDVKHFYTWPLSLGHPIHVAVTRSSDGFTSKLYLNGHYISSVTHGHEPTGGDSANVRVSVGYDGNNRAMYGYIHALRWTHEEWSEAQIRESFESCRVTSCTDAPPTIAFVSPTDTATNISVGATVTIDVTGVNTVDETQTRLYIDDAIIYANERTRYGFDVERSVIGDGHRYVITAPRPWRYESLVRMGAYAIDTADRSTYDTGSFTTEDAPCFDGPVSSFEESLLSPYSNTALVGLETLRSAMLKFVVDTIDPYEAIRYIFLTGHDHDLEVMLRELVPVPTPTEAGVRLCYKKTRVAINTDLQGKLPEIRAGLAELTSLKLPGVYRKMLQTYADQDDPMIRVPLVCLMILLAKALETDTLVI